MAADLITKLGIKSKQRVWTINSPSDFLTLLEPIPTDIELLEVSPSLIDGLSFDVAVLFSVDHSHLQIEFEELVNRMGPKSAIWCAWPKLASKINTDLRFEVVQHVGLSHQLVDNKICSIDSTWSALRFVVRLKNRKG